jgi:hypothetical protein
VREARKGRTARNGKAAESAEWEIERLKAELHKKRGILA